MDEEIAGPRKFCVSVTTEKRGAVRPLGAAPLYYQAGFFSKTNGYLDVNGRRVSSWTNSALVYKVLENGGSSGKSLIRITLAVDQPSQLSGFWVGGDPEDGILDIREIPCDGNAAVERGRLTNPRHEDLSGLPTRPGPATAEELRDRGLQISSVRPAQPRGSVVELVKPYEKLSDATRFCVEVTAKQNPGHVTQLRVFAKFQSLTYGYFDVDSRRVMSWKGRDREYLLLNYLSDGKHSMQLTLGLDSPATIQRFWAGGDEEAGISDIRQTPCQTDPSAPVKP
jgi:hypothetical protein